MPVSVPAFLTEHTWFRNPVGAWLIAVAVLLGVFGVLVVVRRLLLRRLERFAAQTATWVDDVLANGVRRTSKVFLFVIALTVATRTALTLPAPAREAIRLVAQIAFLLQAAAWINGAITFWLTRATAVRAERDKASLTTINALGVLARIALFTLLFLLALDAFGINITALITGLGIVGVAVALAVQNILGDLFASLSIVLDKPFVIGDFIVVDAYMGTVEDIGLKTTRLRSLSGEQIIFSNNELLKARIRNFQRQSERRVAFTLTFPLETPPDAMARVPAIVRETVSEHPQVRFDRSHFHAITDQALAVETVYIVTSADYNLYMDIQQRINLALLRRFAEAGIRLAVPTRSIVVRDSAGAVAAAGA